MRHGGRGLLAGLLVLAGGCTTMPDAPARISAAEQRAAAAGLEPVTLQTGRFSIQGFARQRCIEPDLNIYIEGDGLAWLSVSTPSPNPTPVHPVALALAAQDPGCSVVYLGRPGQYDRDGVVEPRYWLAARFAPEVVAAYAELVAAQAAARRASRVHLVGYSGGGAIAALVAADLRRRGAPFGLTLRTVAGNLDTLAWARGRRLSPLSASLNPADAVDQLKHVPQLHLLGRRDRQVPPRYVQFFLQQVSSTGCAEWQWVDAAHAGPWEPAWQAAARPYPVCRGAAAAAPPE